MSNFFSDKMICMNCGRTRTEIHFHHVVPRCRGGRGLSNLMQLCSACERFLHWRYSHRRLQRFGWTILQEPEFAAFGKFVRTPHYRRRRMMVSNVHDFRAWLGDAICNKDLY